MTKPSTQQIAAMLGCTPDQVRAQFTRNAVVLRKQEAKARATGRKVGGNTADQWADFAAKAEVGAQA